MSLDLLLAAMFNNLNRSLIEVNFFFTANKQTYKIKVNPKDKIWQYLYRFSVNQKELNGIIEYITSKGFTIVPLKELIKE